MKSSSKSEDSSELILIGKVVAAHGIKGAVKVVSYAESLDSFYQGAKLWSRFGKGPLELLEISWSKAHKKSIRLGFKQITTRNQAEAAVGRELFINKSQLPELEEDTYYWFDLIGLKVKTEQGELIGYLKAILPTSANDVYVIECVDTSKTKTKECLIPAVANYIQTIDLNKKVMVVHLPEGL